MSESLTREEETALLRLARASIEDAVLRNGSLDATLAGTERTPIMNEKRATFVTIRKKGGGDGSLRGCIGNLEPEEPLFRSVIENARRSALRDPRFSPVGSGELDRLRLEISVLTPLAPVSGPDEIVVGRDGVELEKPPFRAVFLPQVATEQGWDRETLLEQLALKAGLPREGWRQAKFYTFQAIKFEEEG